LPRVQEKYLHLSYRFDPEIPRFLRGDAYRLQQVLNNLVGNAVKFTENGEVFLDIRMMSAMADKITLRFTVVDTGIGISPEEQGRLFQSFSQVDSSITRKYGGTGLGLAICKSLINLMGGDIWVESQKGKGSRFSFVIQLEHARETIKGEEDGEQRECLGIDSQLDILIVEDEKVNQKVIASLFEQEGHFVQLADNGKEAVDAVAGKDFDLIVMDVQMPGMDGMEAAKIIRGMEQNRGLYTPIIALTAHALQGDREKFLRMGMDEYVAKPFQPGNLFKTIRKVLLNPRQLSGSDACPLGEGQDEYAEKKETLRGTVLSEMRQWAGELKSVLDKKKLPRAEKLAHLITEGAKKIELNEGRMLAFKIKLAIRRGDWGNARTILEELENVLKDDLQMKCGKNERGGVASENPHCRG
jgi:CheY-like chemotaxis protein